MGGKKLWNKPLRTLCVFNISNDIIDEILGYKVSQEFLQKVILALI